MVNHANELTEYTVINLVQLGCFFGGYVFTPERQLQPNSSLLRFALRIAKPTNEVSGIATLTPCFADIRTNRSRCPAHLIDHREPLFTRRPLRDFEYHRSINGCMVNSQFFVTSYVLHGSVLTFFLVAASPCPLVSASFFSAPTARF